MGIHVSVVIATHKRPLLLAGCLKALSAQNFPCDEYEIIVVDNAKQDETRLVVEGFSTKRGHPNECKPEVRYVTALDAQGPAAARNVGWEAARGEIIAFTDDDCLPDHEWLREGVSVMDLGFDGVSGRMIVPTTEHPTDYEKNISRLETHAEFVTANCFYRCEALQKCGGFDERFGMAWREDSDLFFQMLDESLKLGYAPAAIVLHPVRYAPWGVSVKDERKSIYNALLFKKHPERYRSRIESTPPWRYYLILLCIVGSLVALASGHRTAAAVLAGLWLLLTVDFAIMRLRGTRKTFSHILEMFVTSILIPPLSIYWRLRGALKYKVWFL